MRGRLAILAVLLVLGGASLVPSRPVAAATRCFPETGKCVGGLFYAYWAANGGLAQQGYPLTDEFDEVNPADGRTYRVQYFERARFEWHPELAGTPYEVQLGLLGREQYAAKYPQGQPPGGGGDVCFEQTRRCVRGAFYAYWQRHGGLAQQGYPLSDEFDEVSPTDGRTYRVQYFERARFEWHPEHAGTPAEVLLGLLGREQHAAKYPGDMLVENCPDPATIQGQDGYWYLYCTADPLGDHDRAAGGALNYHLIPILRSLDLAHWAYVGDAFAARPSWVAPDAGLWAPDIRFFNGRYYLYYTAAETSLPGGGSAIGVATAPSPAGPWTDSGRPVVEPQDLRCCPALKRWVYDPWVIADDSGQRYLFYGSYSGGIAARSLSADGLRTDPASETPITVANRYEGVAIIRRGGFYYLFVSATNCCNGPLTGYTVFAGRSADLLGPYTDRDGVALLASRVGGTPVLAMNGNRWVGPGHNTVVTDLAGQDWFLYHAVDRFDPFFAGRPGYTKRAARLDPLDWLDGWPAVRGGRGPSDALEATPAAQPGDTSLHRIERPRQDVPGVLLAPHSDEFDGDELGPQWGWVRGSAPGERAIVGGALRFDTQAADLFGDSNDATVLLAAAPPGDYLVETRLALNVPPGGCCYNFVQAGLVIYGDDDNYVRLTHIANWETRQTDFAKEVGPAPPGYPRFGNAVAGPPEEWTYLRIARRGEGGEERYTAYTSRDGVTWLRGPTWTHALGSRARIGLLALGGGGFIANFDYVRVYTVSPP